ncbi:MAG: adenylyltransferase/cytidyltransferase family protein [Acidimicrobiales bacterium]
MKERLGCCTGRFQPVHEQHLELFSIALQACRRLVVAVTNPDTDARHVEPTSTYRHLSSANPFTYYERTVLLGAALKGAGLAERCSIVPFDLTRSPLWPHYVPLGAVQFVRAYSDWEREKAGRLAAAGYRVVLLDGDPARQVRATDIRSRLQSGGWEGCVPPAIVPPLEEMIHERTMAERS